MNINPKNAFPKLFHPVIEHYCEVKGYPQEYFCTAMLAAISTAVGRMVELNTGNFTATGIIWAAIVGKPGLTKSEAQYDAFKPIKEAQFAEFIAYQRELDMLTNEKQRDAVPNPTVYIINDITPEALVIALAANPKGCGMIYDELAGFVKRFDRYAGGADEQMYLSLFNGDMILRTRVNSKTNASAKHSFLTIMGTIQPDILHDVFNQKNESGFYDRWLLCYPEDIKKKYPHNHGLNPSIEKMYAQFINNIMVIGFEDFLKPHSMGYTPTSYAIINTYQCLLIDRENATENDKERSILAKMEIYLHRFALLIQISEYALDANKLQLMHVSDEAANAAVLLTEYFISQATKVRVKTTAENLNGSWKVIYDALPEPGSEFDRGFFINCCLANDIKQRTADNFLKQHSDKNTTKLFFRISHGKFTKNL